MALTDYDGFEHGVISSGLYDSVTGTVSSETTIVRNGSRSLKCDATSAAAQVARLPGGSAAILVSQFAFYIPSALNQGYDFAFSGMGGGNGLGYFRHSPGRGIIARLTDGVTNVDTAAFTYTPDQWYLLTMLVNVGADPWTLDWSIDGAAQAQATLSKTASTLSANMTLGPYVGAADLIMYFDDWARANGNTGDYPMSYKVLGYSPNAVGTHSLDASTSAFFFKDIGGSETALTTSETTSYQQIDGVPLDGDTDHVLVRAVTGVFPTIPTVAATRVLSNFQADTTATRTFPNLSGLTKNSGDLLIAIVVAYQSNPASGYFSGWTAGWTEFGDVGTSTTMCIGAAYKWSTGSETGTISVTQAATITGHAAMILLSIPGAHASTPPELGSYASGTGAANPASFNPAGWDSEETLWIAVGASGETSLTGSYTGLASAPTNYGNYADTGMSADAIGAVEGAVAFRQLLASSDDVGAFTGDTSNARDAACVIAVRPATVGSAPTTSHYLEYGLADSAESTAPIAVRGIVAMRQDSAANCAIVAKLRANGNDSDIYSGDINSATNIYKTALFTTAPGGAAWTDAIFDGATLRWGYTNDADGTPRLVDAIVEALFAAAAPLDIRLRSQYLDYDFSR